MDPVRRELRRRWIVAIVVALYALFAFVGLSIEGYTPLNLTFIQRSLGSTNPNFFTTSTSSAQTGYPCNYSCIEATYRPTMTLSPTSGAKGTQVYVSGGGWYPNELLSCGDGQINFYNFVAQVDSRGFMGTTITVAYGTAGSTPSALGCYQQGHDPGGQYWSINGPRVQFCNTVDNNQYHLCP